MPRRPKGKVSAPSIIEARKRLNKALELRLANHTFEEIAEILGYKDESGPRKAVTRFLDNYCKTPADELRNKEVVAIDKLTQSLWTKARKGDVQAVGMILKCIERKSRLLGMDLQQHNLNITNLPKIEVEIIDEDES